MAYAIDRFVLNLRKDLGSSRRGRTRYRVDKIAYINYGNERIVEVICNGEEGAYFLITDDTGMDVGFLSDEEYLVHWYPRENASGEGEGVRLFEVEGYRELVDWFLSTGLDI